MESAGGSIRRVPEKKIGIFFVNAEPDKYVLVNMLFVPSTKQEGMVTHSVITNALKGARPMQLSVEFMGGRESIGLLRKGFDEETYRYHPISAFSIQDISKSPGAMPVLKAGNMTIDYCSGN
jgi:hypothetical protein